MFDIVIPLYNKERFIGATLESVLAQTYKEWRLFIVDDGSGDEGPVIVERYHDERIQLMRQANQGVGPARNRAMRQGSADWIALLDADDIWNVDHLEELDAIRQAFPQTVLIGCGYARLKGDALPRSRSSGRGRRRLSRYFAESAHGRQPFITSSVAVRRSAIAEVGEFKPLPGNEDVELWARLALHGPVASSTKSTVHYRIDTGGITDLENRKCPTSTQALRREDLSSTIPTLAGRLPDIQDLELRHDIVEYIDSRIGLSLVRAVRAGQLERARALLGLYDSKPIGKARLAAAITKLPDPIAKMGVRAALRLKDILRAG